MSRPTLSSRLAILKEFSKSGIVALVLISVFGGYLVGQPGEIYFSVGRLLETLAGVLFLASGSSALNQYQERVIDASMPRTAKRPLPSGKLSPAGALAFIMVTLALGLGILADLGVSVLCLGIAAVALYNGLYTLWWKKHWSYAAVPGAIPGALPILIGYASASGEVFAPAGLYLFFILFFWQMPHFWVLALRYKSDYEKGGFPTLPVTHGEGITVERIRVWCLAYAGLILLAPLFLHVGLVYLVIAIPVILKVLWELRAFARAPESKRWLHFFLWVNFSLILVLAAAVLDLWHLPILAPILTRGH
ncbi:MAG: UbiA family prenyltransferase [Bdellovibrionota bacterium]